MIAVASRAPKGSDRWWLDLLLAKRDQRPKQRHAKVGYSRRAEFSMSEWHEFLDAWASGDQPLPTVADEYQDATRDFMRMCRIDYAHTILTAATDRLRLLGGFADSAAVDDALRRFQVASGAAHADTVMECFTHGVSAYAVHAPAVDGGLPRAEAISPLVSSWSLDPDDSTRFRAFVKLRVDDDLGEQSAHLFLPAKDGVPGRLVKFVQPESGGSEWDLDSDGSADFPDVVQEFGIPVVPFVNKRGQGEFERSIDLLERITNDIADRLWTQKFQAFVMRVLEDAPEFDSEKNRIDYSNFRMDSDPASVSVLPPGAKLKESRTVDLTPLLSASKEDIRELAVSAGTPFRQFMPDVEQSAEGARAGKEQATNKGKDRRERFTPPTARAQRIALAYMGHQVDHVEPTWAEVDEPSESEMWQAYAMAPDLPVVTRLREVLRWEPERIARAQREIRAAEYRQKKAAAQVPDAAQQQNPDAQVPDAQQQVSAAVGASA